ncbi:hypothetical protein [Jeotgalibacillus proteolyticus]|uniref:Yip1 domain-containing protein n=1 Tax=Jeotgalibacillus proteolyticus TaxID=2082395 RepID=A0A2S5G9B7_9BACL|nr:hypothetical protein [Jeotgalibacillus proteolyticus]PPA69514.1 hypothetical protein C4B60_13250 [Jeotgalibacillus proteolyticus]
MKFSLIRGLKAPLVFLENWKMSDSFLHIKRNVVALFIISILIFGAAGWIGMGTERWSGQFITFYGLTHDLQRFYFFLGRVLLGIGYPAILLLMPTLLFWLLARRGYSFREVFVLQLFPLSILLLEQLSYVALMVWQGINWYSSPFSWGVIGQLFTTHHWTIYFLGCISLFKLWVMYWQFLSLRSITTLKWWAVIMIVLLLNLLFWAITATFSLINFHHLLFS